MKAGEMIMKSFGIRLRKMRDRAEMSADTLAAKLKMHRNTIYQLERGDQWVGADTLEKICAALQITPDRLFSDVDPKPSPLEALDALRDFIQDKNKPAGK